MLSNEYISWRKSDRLLRGWIIYTLLEESLSIVVGVETTYDVCEALKIAHAKDSQEREFTLRQQMTYFCKHEDKNIDEHICKFKSLCDSLVAIAKPVPDKKKGVLPPHKPWSTI